jgi:hypothetical protein
VNSVKAKKVCYNYRLFFIKWLLRIYVFGGSFAPGTKEIKILCVNAGISGSE